MAPGAKLPSGWSRSDVVWCDRAKRPLLLGRDILNRIGIIAPIPCGRFDSVRLDRRMLHSPRLWSTAGVQSWILSVIVPCEAKRWSLLSCRRPLGGATIAGKQHGSELGFRTGADTADTAKLSSVPCCGPLRTITSYFPRDFSPAAVNENSHAYMSPARPEATQVD